MNIKTSSLHYIDKDDFVVGVSFRFRGDDDLEHIAFHLGSLTVCWGVPEPDCAIKCESLSLPIRLLILFNGGVWYWGKAYFPDLSSLYHFAWICRAWELMNVSENFLQETLSEWQDKSKPSTDILDEIPF